MLDRHAASAQDAIDAVKKVRPDMDEDEVRPVKDFIREADNSKHLLSALHDTAAKRALEVEEKLKAVSTDLTVFLTEHVKNNLNDMLECASSQVWPVDTLLSHFFIILHRVVHLQTAPFLLASDYFTSLTVVEGHF